VDAGKLGRLDHRLVRHRGVAERDVLSDGRAEQIGPLRDDADLPAQRPEVELGQLAPVEQDPPGRWKIQAEEQVREGRLAGTRASNDAQQLTGLDLERDILHHRGRQRPSVGERDAVGPYPAGEARSGCDGLPLLLPGRVQHVVDALHVAAQ
jgi:hypothetical protein